MTVLETYRASDAQATRDLYARLEALGPMGRVAMNLLRAQKASERAKVYRGGIRGQGSFKSMAYDKKTWSMAQLCEILEIHATSLGMRFGWKEDPDVLFGEQSSWVLYVDTPHGQVSFHSPSRGRGPEYHGEWDGQRGMSVQRVIDFATTLLNPTQVRTEAPPRESQPGATRSESCTPTGSHPG